MNAYVCGFLFFERSSLYKSNYTSYKKPEIAKGGMRKFRDTNNLVKN